MSNETADLQMFNSALERALVAECDSQRAEIERLRAESEAFRGKLAEQCGQTLVARAEIEQLIAALREAARRLIANGDGYGANEAMAALEPKP